jgi:hypothetical protein
MHIQEPALGQEAVQIKIGVHIERNVASDRIKHKPTILFGVIVVVGNIVN